jgi:hypothetical protein
MIKYQPFEYHAVTLPAPPLHLPAVDPATMPLQHQYPSLKLAIEELENISRGFLGV